MRVFVKNMRGEALMPCSQRKARLLLKEDKAKIIDYKPFTIQLKIPTGKTSQKIDIGVDTGAAHIGIAIISEDKVLAKGEIKLRDGIHETMILRSTLRRSRRSRNLRYRPARWNNRKRKDNWLPPTVKSKLDATFFWIDKFLSLVPNPNLHIEIGKFDTQRMQNPHIEKWGYQNGQCYDYFNVRYFVLARDNYTCQICKKKNGRLHTHHIVYRSKGGSDRANNLITVCENCHTSEAHKEGGILYDWMIKGKKTKKYKEATYMNIIQRRITHTYPDADITYGFETSPHRIELELDKTHYNDAIAISKIQDVKNNQIDYFYIKQFRKKKRSLHETIPTSNRRKEKNTTCKRKVKNVPVRAGFYMNDMVHFREKIGWIYGFSGGDKGKECVIRNAIGEIIRDPNRTAKNPNVKMSSLKMICHNNNWQYILLME